MRIEVLKSKIHKAIVGDIVIVISYASMEWEEAKAFKPTIIFPNPGNRLN